MRKKRKIEILKRILTIIQYSSPKNYGICSAIIYLCEYDIISSGERQYMYDFFNPKLKDLSWYNEDGLEAHSTEYNGYPFIYRFKNKEERIKFLKSLIANGN